MQRFLFCFFVKGKEKWSRSELRVGTWFDTFVVQCFLSNQRREGWTPLSSWSRHNSIKAASITTLIFENIFVRVCVCVCVIKCVGVKLSRQHTPCLPRHRFKLSWKCRNLLLIIIFFPPCSSSVKHGRQNPPDSLPFFPAFPSNLFHVVSLCSLVRLERSDSAEHFQNALFFVFFFPFSVSPG